METHTHPNIEETNTTHPNIEEMNTTQLSIVERNVTPPEEIDIALNNKKDITRVTKNPKRVLAGKRIALARKNKTQHNANGETQQGGEEQVKVINHGKTKVYQVN